jgi:hypothetical protein
MDGKAIIKENGNWHVNGFEASPKKIDRFFEALAGLEVQSLVSRNPKNHKNFDVTEENGITLSLSGDSATSIFIVGRYDPASNVFYVKKKGSDRVYSVSGSLRGILLQSISDWRNKTMVNIQREDVQKIEIAGADGKLVIKRIENGWQAESGAKTTKLDETAVNRMFSALQPLEASGFLDEEKQKEFKEKGDKTVVRIFGRDGNVIAEIVLLKRDNEWWAKVKGKNVIYKVPLYKISDIVLEDKVFEKK